MGWVRFFVNIRLIRLGEMLIEERNGAYTFVELLQTVALVGRVDGVLREAKAN